MMSSRDNSAVRNLIQLVVIIMQLILTPVQLLLLPTHLSQHTDEFGLISSMHWHNRAFLCAGTCIGIRLPI